MKKLFVAVMLAATAVSACGGADEADPVAAPARSGLELFEEPVLGGNPGCVTCHSREPGASLIGPSLAGVATRAATRIPGTSARDYLHESITAPGGFLAEDYKDQMPGNWSDVLTNDEIDSIVSYLLTLEG